MDETAKRVAIFANPRAGAVQKHRPVETFSRRLRAPRLAPVSPPAPVENRITPESF
jgi:hypothetical protein